MSSYLFREPVGQSCQQALEVDRLTNGEDDWKIVGAEALFLCTGAGKLRVQESSSDLSAGAVVLIPRGTRSMVTAPAWRLRIRTRALAQNLVVDRHAGLVLRSACRWSQRQGFVLTPHSANTANTPRGSTEQVVGFKKLRMRIKSCCTAVGLLRQKAAFFELLADLAELVPEILDDPSDPGAPVLIRELLEHLAEHFAEPLQVADAQAITGLSRSHFHAAFRQATGTTFLRYLTGVRVGEAALLLRHTKRPILDIAYSCGFGSPSRFFKAFKEQLGTTPERYRTGHEHDT